MQPHPPKNIIISLIKDDLINTRLVHALNKTGLNAGHYLLDIGSSIFSLLCIHDSIETEFIYNNYLSLISKVQSISIASEHTKVHALAEEIYHYLIAERDNWQQPMNNDQNAVWFPPDH